MTKANEIQKPWRVVIHATVTEKVEESSCPACVGSIGEAIDDALDTFRMNRTAGTYKIERVEATRNTDGEGRE